MTFSILNANILEHRASATVEYMERYRSGHNEAVLKTVCPQGRVGSNPTLSAFRSFANARLLLLYNKKIGDKMLSTMKEKIYEPSGIMKKEIRMIISAGVFVILLAGTLFLYYHNPKDGLGLVCPIYTLTGYYCPGCGAGRACYAILHMQFYQAFRYNPLLVLILPWLILYYLICWIQWLICGREKLSVNIPLWIPMTVLIMMLIYGIVRNIGVYPFTVLAPTKVL